MTINKWFNPLVGYSEMTYLERIIKVKLMIYIGRLSGKLGIKFLK